jgi:hypothetical protein
MIEDEIRLLLIYEILGRPPEHIKEAFEKLMDQIGKNPGIKILERKVHEPHLVENEKLKELNQKADNLFSTFAEVEIEVDNLDLVFQLAINTLPSSVEILEPSELKLKNFDLNSVLGGLTAKLHQYDEVAKAIISERNQLIKVVKELDNKLGGGYVKFDQGDEKKEVVEEKKKEGSIEDIVGGEKNNDKKIGKKEKDK